MEPLRSAKRTVTCLRSPSRAALEVRIFSARCFPSMTRKRKPIGGLQPQPSPKRTMEDPQVSALRSHRRPAHAWQSGPCTSYESHWFPVVRTTCLLRHFRFHGALFIGPNGPSASPSSLVWVWRVSAVPLLGAAFAWLALTAQAPAVSLLEPLASAWCPAAKTSWSYQ